MSPKATPHRKWTHNDGSELTVEPGKPSSLHLYVPANTRTIYMMSAVTRILTLADFFKPFMQSLEAFQFYESHFEKLALRLRRMDTHQRFIFTLFIRGFPPDFGTQFMYFMGQSSMEEFHSDGARERRRLASVATFPLRFDTHKTFGNLLIQNGADSLSKKLEIFIHEYPSRAYSDSACQPIDHLIRQKLNRFRSNQPSPTSHHNKPRANSHKTTGSTPRPTPLFDSDSELSSEEDLRQQTPPTPPRNKKRHTFSPLTARNKPGEGSHLFVDLTLDDLD